MRRSTAGDKPPSKPTFDVQGGGVILNPFEYYTIPVEQWVGDFVRWLTSNYRDVFQTIKIPVEVVLDAIQTFLVWMHPLVFLVLLGFFAWRIAGWRVAVFSVIAMVFLGYLGVWQLTMVTLAMVLSALFFCAAVGVPLGILAARSDTVEAIIRPVLDVMQTIPTFAYLVPVVMLFSIGNVSGVIATIVFALPPIIRLTNLGIRQVPRDVVEASFAFGSTPWQTLREVQVPLALRTIMAGLNQTLMLALSMVVIASMIGAKGLGDPVRSGINNLQPGLAAVGGVGIVVLAIVLDRITQALGRSDPGQDRGKLWGLLMTGLRLGRANEPLPKPLSDSSVSSDAASSPQEEVPR